MMYAVSWLSDVLRVRSSHFWLEFTQEYSERWYAIFCLLDEQYDNVDVVIRLFCKDLSGSLFLVICFGLLSLGDATIGLKKLHFWE